MKSFIITLVFLLLTSIIYSQVGIGTTTPDSNSQLDIVSNNKGVLLPRLNNTQMNNITNPTTSLLVFNTDQGKYMFYNGGSWEALNNNIDSDWVISGNDIYNANVGNVGIGTGIPTAKLTINGQVTGGFGAATTGGTLDWNHSTNARSGAGYSLLFGSSTNGFASGAYYHPFNFEYSSKNGTGNMTQLAIPYAIGNDASIYLRTRYSGSWSGWSKILAENTSGNVGIGTTSPTTKLEVAGQVKITGGSPGVNKVLTSDATGLGSWVDPNTLVAGDNLGNHTATTGLNMTNHQINNTNRLHLNNGFILEQGGGNYAKINSWIDVQGVGLYSTTVNGAHIYPNATSDYGAWKIAGTRNGYSGFNYNDRITLMMNDNYTGFYNDLENEWMAQGIRNGAYTLFHSGNAKLNTTINGINVTGQVKITGGSPGVNKVLTSDATGLGTWVNPNILVNGDNLGNHTATTTLNMTGNAITSNAGLIRDPNGGWVRTYGATGWYNGTYGGGWYMTESDWIRTYGSKGIYHNAGVMRTDGTFQVGSGGSTLNVPTGGNLAYRSNVLFANTAGNVGIGTASPFAKLHIAGSIRIANGTQANGRVLQSDANGTGTWVNTSTFGVQKIDDLSDGKSDNWSVFLGGHSGENDYGSNGNTGVGMYALNLNTSGGSNIAIGRFALRVNTTGNHNIAIGSYSQYHNKAGSQATAIGSMAMYYSNDQSSYFENNNVALGYESLRGSYSPSSNIGNFNTALGSQTLLNNSSGYYNNAIGYQALYNNTSGNGNIANGYKSLFSNTTGSYNTANGVFSLYENTVSN